MVTLLGDGHKARDIFDQKIGLTIVDAAKVHSILFTLKFFDKKLKTMTEGPLKLALSRLALIFANEQLFVFSRQAIETESVNNQTMSWCSEIYEEL